MTEQEKIISLARECGFDTTDEQIVVVDSETIWITKRMVAFYKLAQSEAYEKAAKGVMGLNKLVDGTILPEAAVDAIRQLKEQS
mgnify:CR=1 FL=1